MQQVTRTVPIVFPAASDPVAFGAGLRRTQGARNGGNYKHGRYTAETIASHRWLREQIREVKGLAKRLRQL